MSYIKNCTKCGQRISLREMSHGQWVAFDANTDKPHKHRKGSQKKANTKKKSKHIDPELPIGADLFSTNKGFSTQQIVVASIVIILLIFFFLS